MLSSCTGQIYCCFDKDLFKTRAVTKYNSIPPTSALTETSILYTDSGITEDYFSFKSTCRNKSYIT